MMVYNDLNDPCVCVCVFGNHVQALVVRFLWVILLGLLPRGTFVASLPHSGERYRHSRSSSMLKGDPKVGGE